MTDETSALPLDDIQGNIHPGFKKDLQAYLFVRFPAEPVGPSTIPPAQAARNWLREIRSSIARADEVQAFNDLYKIVHAHRPGREAEAIRATWLNVGFTFQGLVKLNSQPVAAFPDEFKGGMFAAIGRIGDPYAELPDWLVGGSAATEPDALLIVAADVQADLDGELDRQRRALTRHGLREMITFTGQSLGGGKEHFGFRDNITNPTPVVRRDLGAVTDGVLAGEFILGADRNMHGDDPDPPRWAANGSYLVFRRLRQYVARFRSEAAAAADQLTRAGVAGMSGPLFEAKCVGRWPNGVPVGRETSSAGTAEGPSGPLDIPDDYYRRDKAGQRIPRFAHVRKAHPRQPEFSKPDEHRLIRRGITYGRPLPRDATADDCVDRGLLFVAYQASISEQFEFIAKNWINQRVFPELQAGAVVTPGSRSAAGEDPIVGTNEDDKLADRLAVYPKRVTEVSGNLVVETEEIGLSRFVKMTGGGYFFCPSISALGALA